MLYISKYPLLLSSVKNERLINVSTKSCFSKKGFNSFSTRLSATPILNANSVKSLLEGLKGKIDEPKYIEVGVNYELNSKSYDMVLISHFNSVEDLDKYRVHPEHKKVLDRFSELRLERAAVDFEF